MDESIDTHVTLLSSRDHLQRVIDSLLQDPELRPAARDSAALSQRSVPVVANRRIVASDQQAGSTATETMGLNELKRRLTIWLGVFRQERKHGCAVPRRVRTQHQSHPRARSRVISVGFTSTSPKRPQHLLPHRPALRRRPDRAEAGIRKS